MGGSIHIGTDSKDQEHPGVAQALADGESSTDAWALTRAAELFVPGDGDSIWYAFHARPRAEKRAAEACLDMDLLHYLPLRQSVTRKGKGRYSFEVPLFPGYLFGCCDLLQRLELMRSGHLVRWIEVIDQKLLLEELASVFLASKVGAGLTLYPQLKRGRLVRLLRGSMAGVSGRISRRKDKFRLVLNVTVLGSAVALEVDMNDVELIHP